MAEKLENYIKRYRLNHQWTQEDLAKQVGVSRQSIISIERGKYVPSLMLALKIARIFRCSTDELFQLKED